MMPSLLLCPLQETAQWSRKKREQAISFASLALAFALDSFVGGCGWSSRPHFPLRGQGQSAGPAQGPEDPCFPLCMKTHLPGAESPLITQ